MTREEFIQGYCERSGCTWEWLRQYRFVAPCDCGEDVCEGWQMMSRELLSMPKNMLIHPEILAVELERADE